MGVSEKASWGSWCLYGIWMGVSEVDKWQEGILGRENAPILQIAEIAWTKQVSSSQ